MATAAEIEALIDKQAIYEVMIRYCRGIDRGDLALAMSAYHADAYDQHGPTQGNAHEVMARVAVALTNLEISQHRIANMAIELEGDHAYVETYFHALHVVSGASEEEQVFGRYLDRFERRDGAWKIAHRQIVLDYATCPARAPAYPLLNAFQRGARNKEDPSYERATPAQSSSAKSAPTG